MRTSTPLTYIRDRLPAGLAAAGCLTLALVGGCAAQSPSAPPGYGTMLLVSLSDGSIIRQEIDVDADVCMKGNSEPLTTCLKRGEPVYDADGQSIVGYRMQREEIQLIPK